MIGIQGCFDFMVIRAIKSLKRTYPNIEYSIVLAYMPKAIENSDVNERQGDISVSPDNNDAFIDTIYPDGLEFVHPKYAYVKRNEWMINRADTVVTYISHAYGGAYRFARLAKRKGRKVINLAGK